MTFDSAAWAINGPQISAALARRAQYSATSGQNGVVLSNDLKVSQLDVPGVGVQIAPGVGIIVNDYQDDPNEAYVVSNPSVHTFNDIPPANPSPQSYILAVVVGDPDFSQTGHPFMGSDDPPVGEESTFIYVRPVLIPVAPGATSLDVSYPALALARIDIPASTTTILNSHITDLRSLANPRQSNELFVSPGNTWNNSTPRRIPSGSGFADWGAAEFAPSVRVPSWAKRAIIVCSINGVGLTDSSVNVAGNVRVQLGSVSGPATSFDFPQRSGTVRDNLQCAGEYNVSSVAGTTQILRLEGYQNVPSSPSADRRLGLFKGSQVIYDVRFFEE